MPFMRRCRFPGCYNLVEKPKHYCSIHSEHEQEYEQKRRAFFNTKHTAAQRIRYSSTARTRNQTKINQYNFYRTKQWVDLRKQALTRDYYICQLCGQPNSRTVDHIVPIEFNPSKRAELSNLMTVCRSCHKKKTEWEQKYYGTGKDNKLNPDAKEITSIDQLKLLINQKSR